MSRVVISDGELEGEVVVNSLGGEFYSFKGIPYAAPPVGDLRFKAPQPTQPWDGIRSAKEFGPIAYQVDALFDPTPKGSEDCLYLNVYTPSLEPAKPLPVMVWIHGGGFSAGSGNDDFYGPEFLVRHDVILVTFNYRLGVFGFLSLDTEEIPGNAGMKDQVAALRWVRKNIGQFGGDRDNVTIFGESAGGASVSFHLISPMSKGLFKRAIAQSGHATSHWSFIPHAALKATTLAHQLGCYSTDPVELSSFFKEQPLSALVNHKPHIHCIEKVDGITLGIHFGVVAENEFGDNERFFYGDPLAALRNGIHEGVDVISGFTENEGIFSTLIRGGYDAVKELAENYLGYFVPMVMRVNCSLSEQIEAAMQIRQFYQNGKPDLDGLMRFFTLEDFAYGVIQWQKISAKCSPNKFYLYKFSCKSERNVMIYALGSGEVLGGQTMVCHADDLSYLFPVKVLNLKLDLKSTAFKMIENVTRLWTNFAKYGDPTPDDDLSVRWPEYTTDGEGYLEIGQDLKPLSAPLKEDVDLYESIFAKHLPSQIA